MEKHGKIGAYDFTAEPFHVDFKGRLTLGVLGNHLLNCASMHAMDRGFGIAELNANHYTWVLSRLVIEMEEFPEEYSHFTIETWVENVYRLFTDRNFRISSASGRTLGYARSIWAMIGLNDRKPIDLAKVNEGKITGYVTDYPCPIDKPGRIKATDPQLASTRKVAYSDVDINGHMNSIKYIEHILDLFDISLYDTLNLKRFEIAYVAESRYGDVIEFYAEEESSGTFNIEARKANGETTCRARAVFG